MVEFETLHPGPILQLGPMTTFGPIYEDSSILADGSIMLLPLIFAPFASASLFPSSYDLR